MTELEFSKKRKRSTNLLTVLDSEVASYCRLQRLGYCFTQLPMKPKFAFLILLVAFNAKAAIPYKCDELFSEQNKDEKILVQDENPGGFSRTRIHALISDVFAQLDDSTLLTLSKAGKISLYDYRAQIIKRDIQLSARPGELLVSPDKKTGVNATPYQIEFFDIPTGTVLKTIPYVAKRRPPGKGKEGYNGGLITSDGKRAFFTGENGDLVVVSLETDKIIWIAPPTYEQSFYSSLRESPDGRFVLASRWEGNNVLYDLNTDKAVELKRHEDRAFNYLYQAEFSIDSKKIIFRNLDHQLISYNIADGKYSVLPVSVPRADGMFLSPDGKQLIVTRYLRADDPDKRLFHLLDLATLTEIPVEFPVMDLGPYASFGISKTKNSLTIRNLNNLVFFNFATGKFSQHSTSITYLPSQLGDFTSDGKSMFGTSHGRNPTITEVY